MGLDARRQMSRQVRLLSVAAVAALALCGLMLQSARNAERELKARQTATITLAADAKIIHARRAMTAPIVMEGFEQRDLIERVTVAMNRAGIASQALRSTLPEPPRKARGAEFSDVVTRLQFDDLTLEAIGRFCFALIDANPELSIQSLETRATKDPLRWQFGVSVGYRIRA
ncbi:MAG: hypothetical protein KDA32_08030 [Phycisphaerales bacterium]|nr:hypothetical protein [Phycisphaerales bacterium]